jgi:hypothetical protein
MVELVIGLALVAIGLYMFKLSSQEELNRAQRELQEARKKIAALEKQSAPTQQLNGAG